MRWEKTSALGIAQPCRSYSRQAGSQADEIQVDYKIFKIPHNQNMGLFTVFNKGTCYYSSTNAFQSGFWVKVIVRHDFVVHKISEAIAIFTTYLQPCIIVAMA